MSCKHGNWDCEICAEIDEAYKQGMLDEREACAKTCDLVPLLSGDPLRCTILAPGVYACAAAIRSRGDSECK
jgi:hypothetical protein